MKIVTKVLIVGLGLPLISACCDRVKEANAETSVAAASVEDKSATQTEVVEISVVEQLRAIVETDPVVEAKAALAAGDNRYWGYNTREGRVVPGIEEEISPERFRVAPGMGDTLYRGDHNQLQQRYKVYAKIYNQEIKKAE